MLTPISILEKTHGTQSTITACIFLRLVILRSEMQFYGSNTIVKSGRDRKQDACIKLFTEYGYREAWPLIGTSMSSALSKKKKKKGRPPNIRQPQKYTMLSYRITATYERISNPPTTRYSHQKIPLRTRLTAIQDTVLLFCDLFNFAMYIAIS